MYKIIRNLCTITIFCGIIKLMFCDLLIIGIFFKKTIYKTKKLMYNQIKTKQNKEKTKKQKIGGVHNV